MRGGWFLTYSKIHLSEKIIWSLKICLFFLKSTKEGGLNQSKRILSQKNWGIHNSGSEFWSKSIKKYLVKFAPKECQLMRILLTLMMMINDDDNCSYDCVDVFNDQADGILLMKLGLLMTDSKISFHDCHLWDLVQVGVEIFLNFARRLQCFIIFWLCKTIEKFWEYTWQTIGNTLIKYLANTWACK